MYISNIFYVNMPESRTSSPQHVRRLTRRKTLFIKKVGMGTHPQEGQGE